MLTVRVSRPIGLEPAVVDRATQVVVEDSYGNPLVIVVELTPGTTTIVTSDDDDFNQVLHSLGMDKTVIHSRLSPGWDIPEGAQLIQGPGL